MAYIEFNNISKEYSTGENVIKALDEASFIVEKGELAVVLGTSGAGKTTALNILGGMDTATSGQVVVDGNDVTKYSKHQLVGYRRTDIGFVFQFYNLVPNLTALENVELAVQVCKDALDAGETLEKVGLAERKDNFPAQLSGGEQQRVSIARAIVNGPPLLIADEPTGNLDPKNSMEIMQILEQINNKGITVIVSTHDKDIVNYFRKRVITMEQGQIIRDVQAGTYE